MLQNSLKRGNDGEMLSELNLRRNIRWLLELKVLESSVDNEHFLQGLRFFPKKLMRSSRLIARLTKLFHFSYKVTKKNTKVVVGIPLKDFGTGESEENRKIILREYMIAAFLYSDNDRLFPQARKITSFRFLKDIFCLCSKFHTKLFMDLNDQPYL